MKMNKLYIHSVCLLTASAIGEQPCQAEQNKPPTGTKMRPNIIFLLADDLRADSLGVNGHPLIQTPNIDKLVKDGVNFSNAFTATPVCAPSRISIFLGLPERVHGVGFSSSYKVTEDQWKKSYPALLKENNKLFYQIFQNAIFGPK